MICQKLNTLILLLSIIPSFHFHLLFIPNQGLFFIVPFSLSASTRQNVLAASSNKVSYSHDRKRLSFQLSSSSDANQVQLLFGSVRVESWKQHIMLLKCVWNTTLFKGTSVQLKPCAYLSCYSWHSCSSSQTSQNVKGIPQQVQSFVFLPRE